MQKKYLLWDFDNTLAYRDGMWSHTIYMLLKEYGYTNMEYEAIRPYVKGGFPWDSHELSHVDFFKGADWWEFMTEHFSKRIREMGVKDERISMKIAGKIRESYLDITRWYLYEDTLPCLEKAIMKGYVNIILSNHVPELPHLVKALGIDGYFSRIYTSAKMGYEKPNAQAYKMVLEGLEDTKLVTMIGDNYHADVQGALNAGIDAILVRKENIYHYPKYSEGLEGIFKFLDQSYHE